MGLFRVLFLLFIAYYLVKFFSKILAPAGQKPSGGNSAGGSKVTMQYDRDKAKSVTPPDAGEYVDFEEIKD